MTVEQISEVVMTAQSMTDADVIGYANYYWIDLDNLATALMDEMPEKNHEKFLEAITR